MEKLLTVSVAAYNVETYIRQCLDSLVIPEIMDLLEVYVIDDGGSDGTLEIAKEYEAKYPDTFHAVHKENGGYGSTVNYSLEHATGKYFKMLDGDDWFEKDGLLRFMGELKNARDPDFIVTRYYNSVPECDLTLDNPQEWVKHSGELIDTKNIKFDFMCTMWGSTVRTEIIQNKILKLPEHSLYTDQLFIIYSLSLSKKILCLDFPVYCYRIGREGQSTTNINRAKHYKEGIFVIKEMVDYFCGLKEEVKEFVTPRVAQYHYFVFRSLLLLPVNVESYMILKDFEDWIKDRDSKLYWNICMRSKRIMFIRIFKKIGYYLETVWGGQYLNIRLLSLKKNAYSCSDAVCLYGGAA